MRFCPMGCRSFPVVENGLFGARMNIIKPSLPAGQADTVPISKRLQLFLAICAADGPAKLRFYSRLDAKGSLFPAVGPGSGPISSTIPDEYLRNGRQTKFFRKAIFLLYHSAINLVRVAGVWKK